MSTTKQHAPPAQPNQERPQILTVIGNHVIEALGRPKNLHRLEVRPLWDDRYRVNIFVGSDAVSSTVAHSYFLETDSTGSIIKSMPKIARQY